MKLLLLTILLFTCLTATAQKEYKPFVSGATYTVGQRVSWNGRIYESLKAGKRTANPTAGQYWKDVTKEYALAPATPITLDSLHRLIIAERKERKAERDSTNKEIEALKKIVKARAASYSSPLLQITLDTVHHKGTFEPVKQ